MSAQSSIEWTDHTFNPWWGCTKISTGCKFCYAEGIARRFGGDVWGAGKARRTFGEKHWHDPLKWEARARREGRRWRVFCASMADVFDEDGPESERERLWRLIEETPHLDWQLLTKRPSVVSEMVPKAWWRAWPGNVWIGTSIENAGVLERVEDLRAIPAAVRFLSIEPLLAPVPQLQLDGISWVIVGGESGVKPRPMNVEWVRSIRDACDRAEVPFFFKQWGGRNKKTAGRTLDGRTHDALPEPRQGTGHTANRGKANRGKATVPARM